MPTNGAASARAGSWAATIPSCCAGETLCCRSRADCPQSRPALILKDALASGAERRVDVASCKHAPRPASYFLGRTGHGCPRRAGTRERAAADPPPLQCCVSRARTSSYLATCTGILGRTARQARRHFKETEQITIIDLASAQRAHSKLQNAALRAGLTAAWWPPRLNEHRRERCAAAMPPCSSSRPRRLGRRASSPAAFCQLVRAVRRILASLHKRYLAEVARKIEAKRTGKRFGQ